MKQRKAAITLAAMISATLFSKLLGMIRQIIFASRLGDSVFAVAFTAASKIPLSAFDMLFAAAILGCFIPFYNGEKLRGDCEARKFSSSFFTFVIIASASVSILGVIFSKQLIYLCAPNLSAEASALAAKLLSVMFPMIIFTGAAYVLVGILQSHGSFIVPALVSSISNAGVIIYLLVSGDISSEKGIVMLSAIYVLSWAVQFLTLAVPTIIKHRFPALRFRFKNSGLGGALKMSPAVMVGAWLLPASALLSTFFCSFVSDSSVAAFDYSLSVWLIAAGVLTYGVCNFIFPSLSRLSAQNDDGVFIATARGGVRTALLLSLPVATGMIFLSYNIICLLYYRGSFGASLASECGSVLRILSFAIPAFCVTEVLSRVFYAKKNALIPMISSLCGIISFAVSGALAAIVFKSGTAGIAVSYIIGQYVCAVILFVTASVKFTGFFNKAALTGALFMIFPVGFSAAFSAFLHGLFKNNAVNLTFFENFIVCAIVFSGGCVIYLICILTERFISGHKSKKEE